MSTSSDARWLAHARVGTQSPSTKARLNRNALKELFQRMPDLLFRLPAGREQAGDPAPGAGERPPPGHKSRPRARRSRTRLVSRGGGVDGRSELAERAQL